MKKLLLKFLPPILRPVQVAYCKDHTVQENIDRYHRIGESFAKHGFMPYNNAIINIMEISGADSTEARQMLETRVVPPEYANDRSTIRDATGLRRFAQKDPYEEGGGPGENKQGVGESPQGGSQYQQPRTSTPSYQQPRTSVGAETGGSNVATQIVGTQMGADGREFRPPRASGPQRINPNIGGSRERGHEAEIAQVVRQYRSGQMDGRSAVSAINRITGWGRNRANEILLYGNVSGTTAPGAISGGGSPYSTAGAQGGGGAEAGGGQYNPPQYDNQGNIIPGTGGPGDPQQIDTAGMGRFSTFRDPDLEELFGAGTARQAQYSTFLGNQFPNVSGNFRGAMENRGPLANTQFAMSDVIRPNPAETFMDFLQGGPSSRPGFSALNQVADALRGGPEASGLSSTQRGAITNLSNDPLGQFRMALLPQQFSMPSRFRQGFGDLAQRSFDRILANEGLDPNFQFLPRLQEQGFQFFQ